ncbi:hypothetical protein Ahy_A06g028436 isoform J [Arachis hypogaea]|uniref:Uncharacterized protein n=1 Tax=Arachis hypogaea TaxID=3818 RepID=A0A445CQZ8_ARAHY|nr:hypothetical protein Ahy_A06g028436 isoform J [Arachis hypogaea]
MAFVANAVSLVTYFFGFMNFSLTKSATTLTNFMGTAFLLSLVGGFISDTYLSRFKTCVIFASMELLWPNIAEDAVRVQDTPFNLVADELDQESEIPSLKEQGSRSFKASNRAV